MIVNVVVNCKVGKWTCFECTNWINLYDALGASFVEYVTNGLVVFAGTL